MIKTISKLFGEYCFAARAISYALGSFKYAR
jgi:hypothetical protein